MKLLHMIFFAAVATTSLWADVSETIGPNDIERMKHMVTDVFKDTPQRYSQSLANVHRMNSILFSWAAGAATFVAFNKKLGYEERHVAGMFTGIFIAECILNLHCFHMLTKKNDNSSAVNQE